MNAEQRIAEFRRALDRLEEALNLASNNPLGVDASIQRFEFCYELAWKSLREILARDHGVEVASPKTTLQEAYKLKLIDSEQLWLDMLRDRNLTSHTYRESLAKEIFTRLPSYLNACRILESSI